MAADVGAGRIVLGHTLDDQVETLLYRLGRYAGLDSLAAMHPRSGRWVRPLLTRRRADTAAYCVAHGLAYATDRGNADEAYVRTAIRRYVVPAWEEALPGAVVAAGRAAAVAAEAADLIDEVRGGGVGPLRRAGPAPSREERTAWSSPRPRTQADSLVPLRRALLHALVDGLDGAHRGQNLVLAAEGLLARPGSGGVPLGGGWIAGEGVRSRPGREDARRVGRRPRLGRRSPRGSVGVDLALPGSVVWKGPRISAEWAGRVRAHDPRTEAYLDARALAWASDGARREARATTCGPWGRRGVGWSRTCWSISGCPRGARGRVPLVLSGGRPVWLCGLAVADGSRIRSDTDRAVRLCVEVA